MSRDPVARKDIHHAFIKATYRNDTDFVITSCPEHALANIFTRRPQLLILGSLHRTAVNGDELTMRFVRRVKAANKYHWIISYSRVRHNASDLFDAVIPKRELMGISMLLDYVKDFIDNV